MISPFLFGLLGGKIKGYEKLNKTFGKVKAE
jgi:hypothetical protein